MRPHCLAFVALVAPLLVAGCNSRTIVADSGAGERDGRGASADAARGTERSLPGDGLGGLCGGPPKMMVGGQAFAVTQVKTGIDSRAQCCTPGETIRFFTTDPAGKPVEVLFQMLAFDYSSKPTHFDLSKPPPGWLFYVYCETPSFCGTFNISSTVSDFSGSVDLEPVTGLPQEKLTLCLSTTPKPGSAPPDLKPVKLAVTGVLVNLVCAPGWDQMCNQNPAISSLRGKCNEDSTCTCNAGATKVPSTGKCQ